MTIRTLALCLTLSMGVTQTNAFSGKDLLQWFTGHQINRNSTEAVEQVEFPPYTWVKEKTESVVEAEKQAFCTTLEQEVVTNPKSGVTAVTKALGKTLYNWFTGSKMERTPAHANTLIVNPNTPKSVVHERTLI